MAAPGPIGACVAPVCMRGVVLMRGTESASTVQAECVEGGGCCGWGTQTTGSLPVVSATGGTSESHTHLANPWHSTHGLPAIRLTQLPTNPICHTIRARNHVHRPCLCLGPVAWSGTYGASTSRSQWCRLRHSHGSYCSPTRAGVGRSGVGTPARCDRGCVGVQRPSLPFTQRRWGSKEEERGHG